MVQSHAAAGLKGCVDIFRYSDYRTFLKDSFAALKKSKKQFSYRYFARLAGFGSESFFRMVVRGERNLSPASASKLARGLKLEKREMTYFETLVLYNQAETDADRARYFEQLISQRPQARVSGLTADQFEYLTRGLFVTLREMAALPEFDEDPEWILKRLRRPASAGEVRHALQVLERLKLLVRDKHGRLRHSGRTMQAPEDMPEIDVLNYYRQILAMTRDALLTIPSEDWDFASITLPVPRQALPRITEMYTKCLRDIVRYVNECGKDFHDVYQVNLQIFPVTCVGAAKSK